MGWAHRIHAAALLGNGNPADAIMQAAQAMEILRAVFDQRPSVAAEQLAKAALVQARCLRATTHPNEGAIVITNVLTLLLPLVKHHGAKLGRVLRDLLDELRELAPQSLHDSPATEISASLKQYDGNRLVPPPL